MTADGNVDGIPKGQVLATCALHGNAPADLLEIFHDLQDQAGYIPTSALPVIAAALNRTRAEIYGVFSFYHDFRDRPAGTVEVKICQAEACQAVGANALIREICARRDTELDATSADGTLTLKPVYCLGNCALGPSALVGEQLHGRLTAEGLDTLIAEATR